MLEIPVGILKSIELRLIFLQRILIPSQSLDDKILLIRLHSVGRNNPIFIAVVAVVIAGSLAIFLSPVTLHPN